MITPSYGLRMRVYHVLGGLIYGNMEPGEIDQDRMVEVLFEYKGSRRVLCFEVSTVCDRVEQELRDLGVTEPNVNLSAGLAESDNHSSFFLQKWCSKWEAFINVESIDEIHGNDRLTVVRKPSSSPVKVISSLSVSTVAPQIICEAIYHTSKN